MNKEQSEFISLVSATISNWCTNISSDVADFIGCQFALESKYGTSKLAKEHANFSGMKYARCRPRTSFEIAGSPFADYLSLTECVIDYLFALSYHKLETYDFANVNRFSLAIKNWYCPEKDYINKINSIYQSFKSYQNEK